MIILTRRLAKRLKTVFRQTLNLTTRGNLPTIQLSGSAEGLRIRISNGQTAAEFHLAGEQPDEILYIPFEMLAEIEGGRDVPVEIESRDGKVTASWRSASVPQVATHDAPGVRSENWPPTPDDFAANPPEMLVALRDASRTTDSQSSRFALGCIQCRGQHGVVVASDGREALIQSGFNFPWTEDVLVPANKVFASAQLPNDESVHVGRADDWAVFRIGPWTFWIGIETDVRFPDVSGHIGQPDKAAATCEIPEADRKFLLDNLPRLPVDDTHNEPVTVDLNGHVALRSKPTGVDVCTELILSASSRSGEAIRLNTNRRYLQRAAELGFKRLHVFDDRSPVLACDARRLYVWAILEPGAAIAPRHDAVRIESAPGEQNTAKSKPTRRTEVKTKSQRTTSNPTRQSHNGEQELPDPITAAEELRDSLRQSLQSTTMLVRTLKRHRKRNKAVESTLLSLRQLQAIDA